MLICAICGEPNSFLFAVEQHIAERLQSNLLVALTNQEGNIIVATAKRNHTHGNVAHSIERFGFETYVLPLQVAYDADDTHVFVCLLYTSDAADE